MTRRRVAAVQVGLLFVALCANAAVKNDRIRITVLDAETHSVNLNDNGVPKNCDAVNFDAYCHNSKTTLLTNTLLVQKGNEPPFRITCTVDTKWSRCVPLPKGQTFDAKQDKRGLIVYYADDRGKVRKQLYTLVEPAAANSKSTATPEASPVSPAPSPDSAGNGKTQNESQAPAQAAGAAEPTEPVKCSFTSTPSGAEVTVDGRYVGSTPSVVSLTVGNHVVEVSLPGFSPWKRDLNVSAGSELTVNAVLQRVQ